jgi:acetoacetate decarboxylase
LKSDAFFRNVENFQTFETSVGPAQVPVLYKSVTSIGAFFPASMKKIRKLLPTDKLKPVSIGRGRAIYGILCFEHHDTTIGPYEEVGFGIPCLYNPLLNIPVLPALFDRRFSVGTYVHHLPVTSKIGYDLGVKFWGFPKFMASIKFEHSQNSSRCTVRADDKDIATLAVRKGEKLKPYRWDIIMFTVKDNMLLKSITNTQGKFWNSRKADGAKLSLGDHPVSEELRSLELDMKPIKTLFYDEIQMILNIPRERFQL